MKALVVVAAGWAMVVVGLLLVVGLWTLIPAGVLTLTVGVVADFDPAPREAQRGKPRS